MPGAGSFGCGSAGAGLYAPTTNNATSVATPRALKLDSKTRDFLLDENGRYIAVHPIDHLAMMLLIPAAKTIASAPAQGGRWRDMEIADEATMTRRFEEMVREEWRDLIAAGDVKILRVRARPVNPWGRGRLELDWMNLRDLQDPNRTTSV